MPRPVFVGFEAFHYLAKRIATGALATPHGVLKALREVNAGRNSLYDGQAPADHSQELPESWLTDPSSADARREALAELETSADTFHERLPARESDDVTPRRTAFEPTHQSWMRVMRTMHQQELGNLGAKQGAFPANPVYEVSEPSPSSEAWRTVIDLESLTDYDEKRVNHVLKILQSAARATELERGLGSSPTQRSTGPTPEAVENLLGLFLIYPFQPPGTDDVLLRVPLQDAIGGADDRFPGRISAGRLIQVGYAAEVLRHLIAELRPYRYGIELSHDSSRGIEAVVMDIGLRSPASPPPKESTWPMDCAETLLRLLRAGAGPLEALDLLELPKT